MSAQAAVDLDAVSRVTEALLARKAKPAFIVDRATNTTLPLDYMEVASPRGVLPAMLVAGEAIWRHATGHGFALDVVEDPKSLLGYAVRMIGGGTFSAVMLSIMEVVERVVEGTDGFCANELVRDWHLPEVRPAAAYSPPAPSGSAAAASP